MIATFNDHREFARVSCPSVEKLRSVQSIVGPILIKVAFALTICAFYIFFVSALLYSKSKNLQRTPFPLSLFPRALLFFIEQHSYTIVRKLRETVALNNSTTRNVARNSKVIASLFHQYIKNTKLFIIVKPRLLRNIWICNDRLKLREISSYVT